MGAFRLLSGETRIRCLLDFGKRQRMHRTKAITRRLRPGRALRHALSSLRRPAGRLHRSEDPPADPGVDVAGRAIALRVDRVTASREEHLRIRSDRARLPRDRFHSRAPAGRAVATAQEQASARCGFTSSSIAGLRRHSRILHAALRDPLPARSGFRRGSGRTPLVVKPRTECLLFCCKHSGRGEACRDLELAPALDGAKGRPRRSGVAGLPL